MNVLFLTTSNPYRVTTGSEYVSSRIIEALESMGCRVDVVAYERPGRSWPQRDNLYIPATRFIESSASLYSAAWNLVRSFLTGKPYCVAANVRAAYRGQVVQLLRAKQYAAVLIDHLHMMWTLQEIPAHIATILVEHNVETEIYAPGGPGDRSLLRRLLYRREHRLIRPFEAKALASVKHVLALSERDQANLRAMSDAADIRALPVLPPEPLVLPRDETVRYDVGILGTWLWRPNFEGLAWFVQAVLPLLSDVKVAVAGKGAEELLRGVPQVEYLGFVEDKERFYARCGCIAVPSIAGSGIQIKTLEAISTGKPVVATDWATRGLERLPGNIRAASSPQAFAQLLREAAGQGEDARYQDEIAHWVKAQKERFTAVLREVLA